jgi:hypothetical protein
MICRARIPGRPTTTDRRWAARRVGLAVEAILRRWPPGSERKVAGLLRTLAEVVERRQRG